MMNSRRVKTTGLLSVAALAALICAGWLLLAPLNAPLLADEGEGDPDPKEEEQACITITEILNGRKNTLGDYTQETDPDKPMRIFVDTKENWDGGDIVEDHYDKQRAKITVQITPDDYDISDCHVRWELRDPDDPADHPDIDGNGATPPVHDDKGGDNTGKEHEGAAHWFTQADHDLIGTPIDREAVDQTTIIGEAKAKIVKAGGKNTSTIFLNYSDDGGDNFKVKAVLVKDGEDKDEDESKILTVWRKYKVVTYAAVEAEHATVLDPLPDAATKLLFCKAFGNTDAGTVAANKNCYVDCYVAQATGNARVGSKRETYGLANGHKVKVKVNGGAWQEKTFAFATSGAAKATEVRDLMGSVTNLTAFCMDADRRAILEATNQVEFMHMTLSDYGVSVVGCWTNVADGNRRWTAFRVPDVSWSAGNETSIFALYYTNYHTGESKDKHRDYTTQLMGWAENSSVNKLGGTIEPHSHVALQRHKVNGTVSKTWVAKTSVHEIGHCLYTIGTDAGGHDRDDNADDYHNTHTTGFTGCLADGTVETAQSQKDHFCPRHVKKFRLKVFRTWPSDGSGMTGE
jgi:hypothetical protein